ncbi:peptide chain release factor-like protein [Oryzomonas sagensis]|uniref:Peptide chain release factor-like protein n=1 Tax=Oryzomonas sagensis TaxID=2603857 RepID=A0ABQ6TTD0_9BACT|nr:peptide chain release factor-like protein [Oryzomonas sagensis]KAB0672077.1 peptide chain release factor-like protein [Oryzomonas sagensis]
MSAYAVSEEKNRWLIRKMAELGVTEEDLEETFVRSSGNGGQHVNKTSTCVQLRHKPSGITVSASRERSQSVNRFLARRELLERLEARNGVQTAEMKRVEKLRKQKNRRRRRTATKVVS